MAKSYEQLRAEARVREERYRRSDKGKATHAAYRRRIKHLCRKEDNARKMVYDHIRYGKLVKPDKCNVNSDCTGRLEAHHDDYDKPLDVIWFCIKHHKEYHLGTS